MVRFLLAYLAALARPDDSEALERVLAASLSGVSVSALGRLRANALEEGRPLVKVVRRLMYRLAGEDPARYPLPWGGETPAVEGSPPDYLEFMTEPDKVSLHSALAAFYGLRQETERLPVRALAYAVLMRAGVRHIRFRIWRS